MLFILFYLYYCYCYYHCCYYYYYYLMQGDRMWAFGVGLFLVRIASENLQLTAAYGLSSGLTIFFLGPLVGDWVDNTPRLKGMLN